MGSSAQKIPLIVSRAAAEALGLPFEVVNFIKDYRERVVKYLLEGYHSGIIQKACADDEIWHEVHGTEHINECKRGCTDGPVRNLAVAPRGVVAHEVDHQQSIVHQGTQRLLLHKLGADVASVCIHAVDAFVVISWGLGFAHGGAVG